MSIFKLLWFQTGLPLCFWPPSNWISFFPILPYEKELPKAFLVCCKLGLHPPVLIQEKTAFLPLQVKLKLAVENPRFFFIFLDSIKKNFFLLSILNPLLLIQCLFLDHVWVFLQQALHKFLSSPFIAFPCIREYSSHSILIRSHAP